jgi:F-type H+-transporting ATPase subunit a
MRHGSRWITPGAVGLGAVSLALVLPAVAAAATENGDEEKFDPSEEWLLHDWIPIHIGPLDLSINKAVAYLILGSVLTILLGWLLMRWRLKSDPDRRQTVGEWVYEITQTQIAEQGLPTKAIGRWFPYVASLALFIWVLNMIGFIPLPISDETFTLFGVELPTLAIYAATSTLSVTLALALMTFLFTHVEGIRENGTRRYFASFMPGGMPAFSLKTAVPLALLYMLEILGQLMRLVSLSVRLYANMLAGHMLILTFIGLMFVLENYFLAPLVVPAATAFYLFEVLIVVSIQAYIFAALSAIYIGSAIEPDH